MKLKILLLLPLLAISGCAAEVESVHRYGSMGGSEDVGTADAASDAGTDAVAAKWCPDIDACMIGYSWDSHACACVPRDGG